MTTQSAQVLPFKRSAGRYFACRPGQIVDGLWVNFAVCVHLHDSAAEARACARKTFGEYQRTGVVRWDAAADEWDFSAVDEALTPPCG